MIQMSCEEKKDCCQEMSPEQLAGHEKYMDKALALARRAYANGDVPIGCVIVHEGKIIARGFNKRNLKKTTLAHAEILAIEQASKKLGDWRLEDQRQLLMLLDCAKRIGLTLTDGYMLTPIKSVTAVIGLTEDTVCNTSKCAACVNQACEFRKE